MQNDSNVQTEKGEIPIELQCESRTYKVKHNDDSTFELEFTIEIKCIDDYLHDHNKFWSCHKDRLEENENDIVAVILKMIGTNVFWWCYQNDSNSVHKKYGVNSIFTEEGWDARCFEITKLYFENYVRDEDFEFEPVKVEGENK